jgi:hypothetical protein
MLKEQLIEMAVTNGSEMVAGAVILVLRYLEKKSLIKKYKKTKEEILRYK